MSTTKEQADIKEAAKGLFPPNKQEEGEELLREAKEILLKINEENDFDSAKEKKEFLLSHERFRELKKKIDNLMF